MGIKKSLPCKGRWPARPGGSHFFLTTGLIPPRKTKKMSTLDIAACSFFVAFKLYE
jgi:hypothetical protein